MWAHLLGMSTVAPVASRLPRLLGNLQFQAFGCLDLALGFLFQSASFVSVSAKVESALRFADDVILGFLRTALISAFGFPLRLMN